jgi:hypothetical protein
MRLLTARQARTETGARALVAGVVAVVLSLSATAASAETTTSSQWTAVADTFVRADMPTKSFGTSNYLYADGSPVKRTYLRFTVTGAPDGPQHTVLRLRQASSNLTEPFCDEIEECWHYVRVSARAVQGGWSESTTWETAPPVGDLLGTAPKQKVRGYHSLVDLDLGTFVNGDGTYEIALTSNTSTNYTFASRERAGAAPLLVLLP